MDVEKQMSDKGFAEPLRIYSDFQALPETQFMLYCSYQWGQLPSGNRLSKFIEAANETFKVLPESFVVTLEFSEWNRRCHSQRADFGVFIANEVAEKGSCLSNFAAP